MIVALNNACNGVPDGGNLASEMEAGQLCHRSAVTIYCLVCQPNECAVLNNYKKAAW